jgi:two-component system, chemotaxis family, response regulator PixG
MTLLQQINFCSEKRFTGRLCITSFDGNNINDFEGNSWNIHFYRGRLVGDSAGIHPIRRLRRQLSQQQVDLPGTSSDSFFSEQELQEPNYFAVKKLLADNYIDREQAEQIIESSLLEVLFDILHIEEKATTQKKSLPVYIFQASENEDDLVPEILIKARAISQKVASAFQNWCDNGFVQYSPNLTPYISSYPKLQNLLPVKTYQKTACLLDNEQTIRDIAVKIGEDLETIMKTVVRYQELQVVSLQMMSDIDITKKKLVTAITTKKESSIFGDVKSLENNILIAHLSNNELEVKTIKTIVENAGHGYINLQEASQVFLTLLKYQPVLILVDDDAANNINSYSLYSQLRRTAKFKDTPIIFLTNDRAKISWSMDLMSQPNEYISKPFSHQKIFTILDKYINIDQLNLVKSY